MSSYNGQLWASSTDPVYKYDKSNPTKVDVVVTEEGFGICIFGKQVIFYKHQIPWENFGEIMEMKGGGQTFTKLGSEWTAEEITDK